MSFPFRTELVVENTIFGIQQAVWEERLWGKSVLEENIRTVALTTGGSLDCFALEFFSYLPNDKRVEQFCKYLLDNYIDADSTISMPVWSECTASSWRTINACELLHAHFNALFYSAHHKIFVLVSALQKNTEWDLHQNEKCHYTKIQEISYIQTRWLNLL